MVENTGTWQSTKVWTESAAPMRPSKVDSTRLRYEIGMVRQFMRQSSLTCEKL
jgi:hypothetical protein